MKGRGTGRAAVRWVNAPAYHLWHAPFRRFGRGFGSCRHGDLPDTSFRVHADDSAEACCRGDLPAGSFRVLPAPGAYRPSHRLRTVLALLLILMLLVACTPATRTLPGGLYLVQRGNDTSWTLLRYADATAETSDALYTGVEGYAVGRELAVLSAGALGLWDGRRLAPLRTCATSCRALSWSADGAVLAWVEGESETGHLWLWTRADGARDTGIETVGEPAWSPVGATLAVPQQTRLALLDVAHTVTTTLDYAVRGRPAWAPDGTRVALLLASGDVVLVTLDPFAARGLDQPPDVFVQREALAWSPDGRWLLVTERRFALLEHGAGAGAHTDLGGSETLGVQPWLYPLEGGAPVALPGDPAAAFVRPAWSPDGAYLALARLPMGDPAPQPEVWVYDMAQRTLLRTIPSASAPTWWGGSR